MSCFLISGSVDSNLQTSASLELSSTPDLKDSSLLRSIHAVRSLMHSQMLGGIDRQLTSEERKECIDRFLVSIKEKSIDLAHFFPEDKHEQAQLLLLQLAETYESETEEDRIKKNEMLSELEALEKEIAKDEEEITKLDEEIAKHDEKIAKHDEKIAKHDEKIARHDEKIAKHDEKIAKHDEKIAKHDEKIAWARKELLAILAEFFYSIFNKEVLSRDKTDEIFDTYLADGSLTVERNSEGKSYAKINTMVSVIKYLSDNPNVKTCDFRVFETAISDIPTLTEYLKTPAAYNIKGVAFKSGISEVAKAALAEASAVRASTGFRLKVQYFP